MHTTAPVNHFLLKWLPLGAVISIIAFLIGSGLLIKDVRRGNQDQARICRVAQRNNETLRSLILLAKANSEVKLKNYPARLRVSQAYYRAALMILEPVDCDHL